MKSIDTPINVAAEINRLHNGIVGALRNTVTDAIEIGRLLTEHKASLEHGEWMPWLEANVSFDDRTARRYASLFENRDKLDTVSNLNDAYRLLSKPRGPKPVLDSPKLVPSTPTAAPSEAPIIEVEAEIVSEKQAPLPLHPGDAPIDWSEQSPMVIVKCIQGLLNTAVKDAIARKQPDAEIVIEVPAQYDWSDDHNDESFDKFRNEVTTAFAPALAEIIRTINGQPEGLRCDLADETATLLGSLLRYVPDKWYRDEKDGILPAPRWPSAKQRKRIVAVVEYYDGTFSAKEFDQAEQQAKHAPAPAPPTPVKRAVKPAAKAYRHGQAFSSYGVKDGEVGAQQVGSTQWLAAYKRHGDTEWTIVGECRGINKAHRMAEAALLAEGKN